MGATSRILSTFRDGTDISETSQGGVTITIHSRYVSASELKELLHALFPHDEYTGWLKRDRYLVEFLEHRIEDIEQAFFGSRSPNEQLDVYPSAPTPAPELSTLVAPMVAPWKAVDPLAWKFIRPEQEGNAARIIGVISGIPEFAKTVARKIKGLTSGYGDNVRTVSQVQGGVESCDHTETSENG
ncbi:hypothetical protein QBC45DRAFT_326001 [Copromyces sp. CBS 386.78]|nr:hypothetical protein QBC45DRAFT_326001 [Copromyces sp. CBS 386.78]